jgi:hypothetical protein
VSEGLQERSPEHQVQHLFPDPARTWFWESRELPDVQAQHDGLFPALREGRRRDPLHHDGAAARPGRVSGS